MEEEEEKLVCIECGAPADYVRHTQFAGSHPYCQFHALREKDHMDMVEVEKPPTWKEV